MKLSAYLTIFCLALISCNREKKNEVFKLPATEDINSITKAIIFDNTFGLVKENSKIPICNELRKIESTKKNAENHHRKFDTLSISNLIEDPYFPVKDFFKESDTAFIRFQLNKMKRHKLPQSVFGNLKTTNLNGQTENGYYYLTVPIFSSDSKRAYVQLTWMYDTPSRGDEIVLKKENNNWEIIKRQRVWAR